ncbi:hypothetical protein EC968_001022 [Mortierella alpina]|nr:hypothetical protein EC968_001022 [Mortierella alpina]
MHFSKTLLISAALSAFMAVVVAQDPVPTGATTTDAANVTSSASDAASGAFFFSDDDDDDDGAGEDAGNDDGTGDDGGNDDGNGDDGDAGAEQSASALVKRGRRHGRRHGHSGGRRGKILAVRNERDFCLLLPPKAGEGVAQTEAEAVSFCRKPHDRATPGARAFPSDFFRSVHVKRDGRRKYIQVTGRFNRGAYHMSKKDQGGQNDPKATKGSACVGYQHFVQLIEPNNEHYCIRCCQNKRDCNTGISTRGCADVIPGDYN